MLAACAGSAPPLPAIRAARPAVSENAPTATVAHFGATFLYRGTRYEYTMVGTDPRKPARTTTIPVRIVPLKLVFADGETFDASSVAAAIPRSPLFKAASYRSGTTQYGDALMRAEFWNDVKGKPYHVLLAEPAVASTVTVAVPRSEGHVRTPNGTRVGVIDFAWFMRSVEERIIGARRIPSSTLTIFATYRTSLLEPGSACCYYGYHNAFTSAKSGTSRTWTTAWASVDKNDVTRLSHEISEWLNDPLYTNRVPKWIQPQTGACEDALLEVGDPVTNYRFTVGGFRVQDEAFFSWFARQKPSIGIGGAYDLMGKLKHPAASC